MTAMARDFRLPDLGEGLTEAEIVKVLVHEGEDIREDAPLLEVETDKAQVEIPSPMSGRVEKVHVQAGQTVKVGQVLVSFGDASATPGTKTAPTDGRARQATPAAGTRATPPPAARVTEGPVPATPARGVREPPARAATRRWAASHGMPRRGHPRR